MNQATVYEIEASDSASVCMSDMVVICNNGDKVVNLTLCPCQTDSTSGVKIVKKASNYNICVLPDKTDSKSNVSIIDDAKTVDCLIIPGGKRNAVVFKYSTITNSWYLQ